MECENNTGVERVLDVAIEGLKANKERDSYANKAMSDAIGEIAKLRKKCIKLEQSNGELRERLAQTEEELDDWKGNAEGFEPDAYMKLPLDADGVAIRPGDKIYFAGDPESEVLICVAIGCWPQPVEFMDWGKSGTTAWEDGYVFTHRRPKPEPPDS